MRDAVGPLRLAALLMLAILCYSVASAETKKVILFPVTDEGAGSEFAEQVQC